MTTKAEVQPAVIILPEAPLRPGVEFQSMETDSGVIFYLGEDDFKKLGIYLNDIQTYNKKLEVYLKQYYNAE